MSISPFKSKFGRYFLCGLGWMLVTGLISEVAFQSWLVERMKMANLDALFAGKEQTVSPDIVVVSITNDDYKDEFGGISPLDPVKLMKVIDDILDQGPKALGIDFDTSGWTGPPAKYAGKPIVWARETEGDDGNLSMGKVLGAEDNACNGVPAYFPDGDGVVREYKQFIQGANQLYYPSLAFNLIEVSQGRPCSGALQKLNGDESADPQKVNFRGTKYVFDHFSVGSLRKLEDARVESPPKPLNGKIVLLGGAYRAARDAYRTPFRYMDGVDIIANTVDMSLPGHQKLVDFPLKLQVAGYLEGVVLLAALYFVSRTWSLVITVLTGPVFFLLVDWIAFQRGSTFISFFPCFVGIVINEIVEHTKEYRHLRRENRELQERISHLDAAAEHAPSPSKG